MNSLDFDHYNLKIDVPLIDDELERDSILNDINDVLKKHNYKQISKDVDKNETVHSTSVEFCPED